MSKVALITGITGQDGAVLARILQGKGYSVHGMREYSAVPDEGRLKGLQNIPLHYGDLADSASLIHILRTVRPDEIYNLAAMSHVHVSFAVPEHTANINALGPLRLLEAIRVLGMEKTVRLYQASSSEMFGRSPPPQCELTTLQPCSPYAAAKLFAYWTVRNYRESYGMHASNGILFNHESPLRGEEFVTRKITRALGEIEAGLRDRVTLGNLDAHRDWGHARDYMEGAWLMVQQDAPDDYVLATGQSHTVRCFVEKAFACIGMTLEWDGHAAQEKGRDRRTGRILVDIDPVLFRPREVHALLGDAGKARRKLGWKPRVSFDDLVAEMMAADRIVDRSSLKSYGT